MLKLHVIKMQWKCLHAGTYLLTSPLRERTVCLCTDREKPSPPAHRECCWWSGDLGARQGFWSSHYSHHSWGAMGKEPQRTGHAHPEKPSVASAKLVTLCPAAHRVPTNLSRRLMGSWKSVQPHHGLRGVESLGQVPAWAWEGGGVPAPASG